MNIGMIARKYLLVAALAALAAAGGYFWWQQTGRIDKSGADTAALPDLAQLPHGVEPILPLTAPDPEPENRVSLGERLFRDPRLSRDNTIACVHCHDLNHGGVDGKPVSTGVNGARGTINAPTVFNARYNFVQFWDGRAASLEEQVAGPIQNPVEMASNWEEVLIKLKADPDYVQSFAAAFPDGLTANNIAIAIASFERTLVTLNSPFDRYLQGDENALKIGRAHV